MDRYIEGILYAYNKVLTLIETLDPGDKLEAYKILRKTIETYKYGYELELEHIDKFKNDLNGFKEFIKSIESNDIDLIDDSGEDIIC